jgi:hypothetical protein
MSYSTGQETATTSIRDARDNPQASILKILGEMFAKPFCRFASMMGVFFVLFGLVAVIDNPGSNYPFLFVACVIGFTFLMISLAGAYNDGSFEAKSSTLIMGSVFGFVFAMTMTFFVVGAPTHNDEGENSYTFSPYSKGMTGLALGYGGFIMIGFLNYINNYAENVDEYVLNSIDTSSPLYVRAKQAILKIANDKSRDKTELGKAELEILNVLQLNHFTKQQILADLRFETDTHTFDDLSRLINEEVKP